MDRRKEMTESEIRALEALINAAPDDEPVQSMKGI
jgi:hypothetical protein